MAAVATSLPADPRQQAGSWVRSVFIDTARPTVIPQAGRPWNTKIRVRSYHPVGAYGETRWFEIKRRVGSEVDKSRVALAPSQLRAVLCGDWSKLPRHLELRDELAQLNAGHPLLPQFAIDYQRTAFQSGDGRLRVTFDRQLYVKVLPSDYFESRQHSLPEHGCEEGWRELVAGCVVEVKRQDGAELPQALSERLGKLRPSPSFSKGDSALSLIRDFGIGLAV